MRQRFSVVARFRVHGKDVGRERTIQYWTWKQQVYPI